MSKKDFLHKKVNSLFIFYTIVCKNYYSKSNAYTLYLFDKMKKVD